MLTCLLKKHRLIALDTSLLIYHLEENPVYSSLTSHILGAIQEGRCHGVLSDITLLELLVLPLRLNQQDCADEYELLLTHFPNLALVPVSRNIILKAASIRALYGLKTPDALIIATALSCGATLLITNDHQWQRITELDVVCLDQLILKTE